MSDRIMPKYLDDLVRHIPDIDLGAERCSSGRRPGKLGLFVDVLAAAEPVFVGAAVGAAYMVAVHFGLGDRIDFLAEQYSLSDSFLTNFPVQALSLGLASTWVWNLIKLHDSRKCDFALVADAMRWRYVSDKIPEYHDWPPHVPISHGEYFRRSADTLTDMRFNPDHAKRIGENFSLRLEGGRSYMESLLPLMVKDKKVAAYRGDGEFYACSGPFKLLMDRSGSNTNVPFDRLFGGIFDGVSFDELLDGVQDMVTLKNGAAYTVYAFIPPVEFFDENVYEKWVVVSNA